MRRRSEHALGAPRPGARPEPRRVRRAVAAAGLVAVLATSACTFGEPEQLVGEPPNLPTPAPTSPGPSGSGQPGQPGRSGSPGQQNGVGVQVLVKGLVAPWGLAFLPDGTALVTERDSARILSVTPGGAVKEVQRLPEVDGGGEGGLLGIAVSPAYETDKAVFVYYTTATDNRIARLTLGGPPTPIVTGIPRSGIHNGGRIAFGPDGFLYAGTGDASQTGRSQDRASLGGKVLRMTAAGRPAPGNPFPGSLVWSLGHRNVQGLAWDEQKRLWASEFGQSRFDEVNLILPGRNYGWPTVEGTSTDRRFVNPLVTWQTSVASPSGAAVAGSTLVVAALRGQRLWAVPLDGKGGVGEPQSVLEKEYGRLRHVANAPDGSLWVLTSNRDGRGQPTEDDDRIIRIVPPGGGSISVL